MRNAYASLDTIHRCIVACVLVPIQPETQQWAAILFYTIFQAPKKEAQLQRGGHLLGSSRACAASTGSVECAGCVLDGVKYIRFTVTDYNMILITYCNNNLINILIIMDQSLLSYYFGSPLGFDVYIYTHYVVHYMIVQVICIYLCNCIVSYRIV